MPSRLKERLLLVRWWMCHMNRRQLRRWLYQVTRPASDPYISGDGFRRLAKHIYDETNQTISPRKIKDGDIVFVCTEYARRFFAEVAPDIGAHYRLITHNSDVPVDESLVSYADDKVQAWFAENSTFPHHKVVPIPIGLENLWCLYAGIPQYYTDLRGYMGPRKSRILSGFTTATNPVERQAVLEYASMAPCVEQLPGRLGQRDYLETLVRHKFLLSPPGNGMDANRTWEAMYLGVVPIVKDSVAMRSFRQLGMPLLLLQSWDELLSISERELETRYEELKSGFDCPALFMEYWRRLIRESDASPMSASRGNMALTLSSKAGNDPQQAALACQVNACMTSGRPRA